MGVSCALRMKQLFINKCRFSCMRIPPILAVMKILHIQILRLQPSMIFTSTISPTKNINIPFVPIKKGEEKV